MSPDRVRRILTALARRYPHGQRPWVVRSNPFQTLIATILSAQTTDDQVDRVTPELFRRFPTPAALAKARRTTIERIVRPVGLHQAKAKNIIAAARMIGERFDGRVPASRDAMTELPGVGRKTANVVLIKAFGIPAMPVDTHVFRLANRIGLAHGATPEAVEAGLERAIPKRQLAAAHFWLIHHGRTICTARAPRCPACPILQDCDYGRKITRSSAR